MDEHVYVVGIIPFFAALVLGPLTGWLLHPRIGLERAVGVASLIIGLTGSVVGIAITVDRVEQLRGMVKAEGHFQKYVKEVSRDSEGNVTHNYAPQVLYKAADGVERVVSGLGGSQSKLSPGEAVPVFYDPEAPERAVVADFQNIWGLVLAFAMFGGAPTMFGIRVLVLAARLERREQDSSSEMT